VPGDPVPMIGGGLDYLFRVSVAQGGRRLAAAKGNAVIEFNHLGQVLDTVAAERRVFLERDTVDVVWRVPTGQLYPVPFVTLKRASGDSVTVDPMTLITGGNISGNAEFAFSPAGDWFGAGAVWYSSTGQQANGWYLFSFEPVPTKIPLLEFETPTGPCGPDLWGYVAGYGLGWSHDGQRAIFSAPRWDACGAGAARTGIETVRLVNGQPLAPVDENPVQEVEWYWRASRRAIPSSS
jgi:hypothetical protein